MRYKVGDKVRVRQDLVVDKDYGGYDFVSSMEELKGKIVTIEEVFSCTYQIKEDAGRYTWVEEMLEPVITNWDRLKETLTIEKFTDSGACAVINELRGEANCNGRTCKQCREWLEQPYQEPSILDDVEKEYLRAVIKPFRDKVEYITLCGNGVNKQYIAIGIKGDDETGVLFPNFEANTMYKGMKLGKEYSLEDLDL